MKKIYFLWIIMTALSLMLFARSGGPGTLANARVSGAPGDGTCSNCHFGGAGGGNITITNSSLPGSYIPGQTYNIQVQIFDNNASVGGFQATIRDALNNSVGTLTAAAGTQTLTLGGKSYIEHNVPRAFNAFQTNWIFSWQAPGSNVGPVTMYVSGNAADGTGGTANDAIYTTSQSLGTLPILWGHFDVVPEAEQHQFSVQWETLQEWDSDYFEIERSLDGNYFETIGMLPAKGSSDRKVDYRLIDDVPVFNQTLFYRIVEINIAGQKSYSPTVRAQVKLQSSGILKVYPNPVIMDQDLMIDYALIEQGKISSSLVDMAGNRIHLPVETREAGRHQIHVPTQSLSAGRYILLVETEHSHQSKVFVIAR